MGRKKGGHNFGNLIETEPPQTEIYVTEAEQHVLPNIFTSIDKDFISITDLMTASGLSYDTCAKVIREIKGVSDVFRIAGCVHRTDYFMYLSRRFAVQQAGSTAAGNP